MEIRPLISQDEHCTAWQQINDCLDYDDFSWAEFERKTVKDPGHRPDLFLGAYAGQGLIGFIVGVLRGEPGSACCNIKIFAVRSEHRGCGVGSALLAALEGAALEDGAVSLEMKGNFLYFFPGLDPRYTPAVAFLLRRGFEQTGDAFNMSADLTKGIFDTEEREHELESEGIVIRRLMPEDRDPLREFMLREFYRMWLMETLLSYENDPPTCHIAIVDGRIEAFAACEGVGEGWFGPMGTAVSLRGKGIGCVLMHRCFQDLQELGYRRATIPWVEAPEFYAKFASAEIDRVFWQYRKPLDR